MEESIPYYTLTQVGIDEGQPVYQIMVGGSPLTSWVNWQEAIDAMLWWSVSDDERWRLMKDEVLLAEGTVGELRERDGESH